jgi:hypothetical protein
MPITIKTLRTTVKVKSQQRGSPLHQSARAERPSMDYAMPIAEATIQGEPDPNKTATLGKGAASNRKPISAKNADPKKVADRVYELLKSEIVLGQDRGGRETDARRR